MLKITLLDYGVGNIHSIKKALELAGASVSVETNPKKILQAKSLVLPGVGAFSKVTQEIKSIRNDLKKMLEDGVPTLAICIGMQVLYEASEEGAGKGIGFLEGTVKKLQHQRLPHIGWNTIKMGTDTIFQSVSKNSYFYFVHSFAPSACGDWCIATSEYGSKFSSAIRKHNVWGFQFHPEKSSSAGQRILKNFIKFAKITA